MTKKNPFTMLLINKLPTNFLDFQLQFIVFLVIHFTILKIQPLIVILKIFYYILYLFFKASLCNQDFLISISNK